MKKFLFLVLLSALPSLAFAQPVAQSGVLQFPGCAAGVVPGQPGCGGDVDDEPAPSRVRRPPPGGWRPPGVGDGWLPYDYEEPKDPFNSRSHQEDRYGAVVDSQMADGTVSVAVNKRSAQEAREAALRQCEGEHCKVVLEFANACVAVTEAKEGIAYASDPGLSVARTIALKSCKDAGYSTCKLLYSGCSLPVKRQ